MPARNARMKCLRRDILPNTEKHEIAFNIEIQNYKKKLGKLKDVMAQSQ